MQVLSFVFALEGTARLHEAGERLIKSVAVRWLATASTGSRNPLMAPKSCFERFTKFTMQPNTTSCAARPEFHLIGAHTISVRLEATM